MDDKEGTEQPPVGSSASEPSIPRKPSGNAKWYAIIVVLLMVIAALGVLTLYHAPTSTGSTVTAVSPANSATAGTPYSLTLQTNGAFNDISIYFGDGTTTTVQYQGSNTVTVNHTYMSPGNYNIFYSADFGTNNTVNNANSLIPVVTSGFIGNQANGAYGSLFLHNTSAVTISNNTVSLKPNTNLSFVAGLQGFPNAGEVVGQSAYLYDMNGLNTSVVLPYYYNVSREAYVLETGAATFNLSGLQSGYYQLELRTTTASMASNTYQQELTFNITSMANASGMVTFNKTQAYTYTNGTFNATMYYMYMMGTQVTMSAGNVSYANGANITYSTGAKVNFTAGDSITFANGANVTLTKNTNVSFAKNTTVRSYSGSGWSTVTYTAGVTYQLNAGNTTNFVHGGALSLMDNFVGTFNTTSTAVLGAASTVQLMGHSVFTYNANTSLFYMDNQTTVDFGASVTNFTQISSMVGTTTVQGSTTGAIDPTQGVYTLNYWVDLPVFNSPAYNVPVVGFPAYVPSTSASGSFLRAELETGGYKTLDPALEYDTVSYEIVMNTLMPLVSYNGTNVSQIVPMLASKVPSIQNGGINNNYANYTQTTPWGTTYNVSIQPYENYTFYINNASKWQDGSSVTAWDAMYSFTRTLLFDAGSPGTPGWIQAQYLLPGNPFTSNTFYNITTNMTVNNATNSITFHFNQPLSPALAFQTFGQTSGAQIADASWLIQHGAGITWSAAGFQAYKVHANAGSYNTYVQNNIMADGPYTLAYSVPSQEVVLQANPNFVSPGVWYTPPTIKTVVLQYIPEESTAYLELKSNYSQSSTIPTSNWNQVQQLTQAGIIHDPTALQFPTLNLFWYNFNANVNETMLSTQVSAANMPSTLFASLNVRKAFAYAYDYNYYINQQVGNAIYNVPFVSNYAGMLPPGMLYQMNETVLNSTAWTNGQVPYYNLSVATNYWNSFLNGPLASAMGVNTNSQFNGKALNVPIFIFSADPIDLAGATTWGQELQKVIPGLQFEVVPTPFPTLLGNQVQGQNPMGVYELGWAPDYPYPTDYLGPMALPSNSTTYPGPNSMTPYWFNGDSNNPLKGLAPMVSQANNLTAMVNDYNNAAANPGNAKGYYQSMNSMLVNMTFYTYIEQQNGFVIINKAFNTSMVQAYQMNIMMSGAGFLYNMLRYN